MWTTPVARAQGPVWLVARPCLLQGLPYTSLPALPAAAPRKLLCLSRELPRPCCRQLWATRSLGATYFSWPPRRRLQSFQLGSAALNWDRNYRLPAGAGGRGLRRGRRGRARGRSGEAQARRPRESSQRMEWLHPSAACPTRPPASVSALQGCQCRECTFV